MGLLNLFQAEALTAFTLDYLFKDSCTMNSLGRQIWNSPSGAKSQYNITNVSLQSNGKQAYCPY